VKISVWLVTRERNTWITAAEMLALGLVLLMDAGTTVRLLFGVPLLLHVGYKAMTSLPMGLVPGRPERGQHRRRYDLRARVVRFLDEVKRAEDFMHHAEVAGMPDDEVEQRLFAARRRAMAAAQEVVRATGRPEPVAHA
jgi:hypothetical protein